MREARIPEPVVVALGHHKTTGAACRLLSALYLHARPDGSCRPSITTLARLAGCSRRTAIRAVGELERDGFFTLDKSPGRPNAYLLTTRDGGVTGDTGVTSEAPELVTSVTATSDIPGTQLVTPVAPELKTFEQKTFEHSAGSPQLAEDFDEWWGEYGRVGDKSRAFDGYRWWRTKGRAPAADLLTAAVCYRDHCTATACLMKHGATFLAKPAKGKTPVWPEWASGEGHGAMDVGNTSHLNDVLVAGAQAFGLNGGDNGNGARQTIQHGRSTEAVGGREIARRSLPPGKLEVGQ